MKQLLALVCVLAVYMSGATIIAAAGGKLPDLVPVVVNAEEGLIEVRNLGEAVAKPSQVYVNCSRIFGSKSAPCGEGLQLPDYIEKWNVLPYDIPALQPGERYLFHVFGSGAFPHLLGAYGMSITADPLKHIAESSESNNHTRLDTAPETGIPSPALYVDLLPAQILSAGKGKGLLQLKVLMAGRLIEAAVLVMQPGRHDQPVLQTKSRRSDSYEHMKQTPFDVALPAGRYDLYVQARVSPLQVYMQTVALPIVIKTGKRLEKTVIIPSGRLRISSVINGVNIAGMSADISGGAAYKYKPSGFDGYSIYKSLKTPFDIDVPPGKYKVKVRNPETRQVQNIDVFVKENSAVEKSLVFNKFHAGFLKVNLLVDGKKIPAKDFYKYAALTITSMTTSKQIKSSLGDRERLASGDYDIVIHELAWGGSDTRLTGIKISDDKTTERTLVLQQPGELQLISRWQINKLEQAGCAIMKPVVAAAVVPIYTYLYMRGEKMDLGEHNDRAKCDPYVNPLLVTYTRLDKESNHISQPDNVYSVEYPAMKTRIAAIRLVPGRYDLKLWPLKHKELQKTLKNIKVESNKAILKELVFDLSDQ